MEKDYIGLVPAQELRNSELLVSLTLLVSGGVGSNKIWVYSKTERTTEMLKLASKALYMDCTNMACDKCKNRFYLKPRKTVLKILAKQGIVMNFDTDLWTGKKGPNGCSGIRSRIPESWNNLSYDKIKFLEYALQKFAGEVQPDGTTDIVLDNGEFFTKQLIDLFAKINHGYVPYVVHPVNSYPRWHLVYKLTETEEPQTNDTDDISDLL